MSPFRVTDQQFDRISRALGAATTRRGAIASALAGIAASGATRAVAAGPVETEDQRCRDKSCDQDKDCGKGLYCDFDTCQYENGNTGKKGDTCCSSNECENDLKCENRTCIAKAADRCKGKDCDADKQCGQGLICDNGRCEYKRGDKGKKGDTCCKNSECKKGLECKKKRCEEK